MPKLGLSLGFYRWLGGVKTSAPIVTDNGNGTATVTLNKLQSPIVTDNGNGTVTITIV